MHFRVRFYRSDNMPTGKVVNTGFNLVERSEITWTNPLKQVTNYGIFQRSIDRVRGVNNVQKNLYLIVDCSPNGGIGPMYGSITKLYQDLFMLPPNLDHISIPMAIFRWCTLVAAVPYWQPPESPFKFPCQLLKFNFESCDVENW